MKHLLCAAVALVSFAGCATDTGDIAKDARGRATNAALLRVKDYALQVALTSLGEMAAEKFNGEKVDFAHSIAEGLWRNSGSIANVDTLRSVVKAYGGEEMEALAGPLGRVFTAANAASAADRVKVVNSLAAGVSEAAFDATGKP